MSPTVYRVITNEPRAALATLQPHDFQYSLLTILLRREVKLRESYTWQDQYWILSCSNTVLTCPRMGQAHIPMLCV